MKRVIVLSRKNQPENPLEVFSNLKLLCASYPAFNYNTLNNYLSKSKTAFENEQVRIERKVVNTTPIPIRKIVMVAKRVKRLGHNEEEQNMSYWKTQPLEERLNTVTRLR